MNYLPHFAILFSVFRILPITLGDILWRWGSAAVLLSGIWRLARLINPSKTAVRDFGVAALLAMPLCMAALRNGQANTVFGGLLLHLTAALAREKWWQAAALLALSIAVKQLSVIMIPLIVLIYPRTIWPVIVSLVALAGFPFLFGPPDYVAAQYHIFFANLADCAVVPEYEYADISGIYRTFGGDLAPSISIVIRALSGAAILGLWWQGARRLDEPLRALWLLALTTGYLMLFNPMNEANSYVILAPVLGIWAVFLMGNEVTSRFGNAFAWMVLSMGLLPNLVRPWFGNSFAKCWHPVMTFLFLGLAIYLVFAPKIKLRVSQSMFPQPPEEDAA
jgi:hypothetical protein